MLTPWTVIQFLCGSTDAVRIIASDRHALGVGFLLTLSAGLARHYDRTDLRRQPWRLVVPAAASAILSFLLTATLYLKADEFAAAPSVFWPTWRAILGLMWMTAPLAWLYGIPWARLSRDDEQAIKQRLWDAWRGCAVALRDRYKLLCGGHSDNMPSMMRAKCLDHNVMGARRTR